MIAIENMSDEQLNEVGAQLAGVLGLKKDREHKDRWQLNGWGNKTNKGLALSLKEMIRKLENGEKIV
jgi:hypothetical protein